MALVNTTSPLVLGRGRLFLAPCAPDQQLIDANEFLFIGNAPEFTFSFDSDVVDHYQSTGGVREQDESAEIQVNRSASIVTDAINRENLARFFFGSSSTLVQAAGNIVDESLTGGQGSFLQVGKSEANPTGTRGISNVTVTDAAGTVTYVQGTDFRVDPQPGLIEIIEGGGIAAAGPENILVSYDFDAQTRSRVISGNVPTVGALQYLEDNARGPDKIYLCPHVVVRPDGDFNLISDEFQQLPLSLRILKLPDPVEALYVDGQPLTAN